jgi:hypothetical protein
MSFTYESNGSSVVIRRILPIDIVLIVLYYGHELIPWWVTWSVISPHVNLFGFLSRMFDNQVNLGQIMLQEFLYPKNTIQL